MKMNFDEEQEIDNGISQNDVIEEYNPDDELMKAFNYNADDIEEDS